MSYDQDVDGVDEHDQWARDNYCYSCSRDESQGIAWDRFNLHRECSAIESPESRQREKAHCFDPPLRSGFPAAPLLRANSDR